MSGYVRPSSLDEALAALADGAAPLGGGTDLAGQSHTGRPAPATLVDLRDVGLAGIDAAGSTEGRPPGDSPSGDTFLGLRIGAATTLATLHRSEHVRPYEAVRLAAEQAASPLLRTVGTVGGNLCQHTRCWYYRGPEWHCWLGGGDTCFAQIGDHRKHNLEPGDCISAHPSDLAPALAACGATVTVRSATGERTLPLLELYRRPTDDDRSLLTLAPGELLTHVFLPPAPDASTYLRAGERKAFGFPLVAVAAVRRGDDVTLVAAGVANVPLALDPADPLAGLPGNPQTGWKRTLLATLVERALGAL
jgi:xanthine dehydrogenase YagS FAD-binding subunit